MYKTIRKKVASSVSEIEKTENFAWGKWLKEPSVQEHLIEDFQTSIINTDQYNSWLEKPAFQKKKFNLKETFVFPENKNLHPKKSKTNTIFFNLIKPEIKKLKLFDRDFKFEHRPEKVEIKSISVKLKDVQWNIPLPKIELKKWEIKSNLFKDKILETGKLSPDNFKLEEFKPDFKPLSVPLKIYKVKITNLDKIRLTKIYYLKNISLHDVRILRESLNLLEKPEIQKEELKYFVVEDQKREESLEKEFLTEETNPVETVEAVSELNEFTDRNVEQQMVEVLNDELPLTITEDITEDINEEELLTEEKQEEKIEEPAIVELIGEEEIINVQEKSEIKEPEVHEIKEDEEPEDVDEDDYETAFEYLYYFQEEGAEFLLENKRAVLHDELGLGKTIQIIAALKNLFLNQKVKSAVIVCEPNEIGSRGKIQGITDGWIGHFHKRAPELKVAQGNFASQERNKQWKNLPDVLVVSYENFLFDLEENVIDIKELKKNICFVFDEIQNLDFKNFNKQKFLKTVNTKYVWAASSYPEEELKIRLEKIFKEKSLFKNYLGRKRNEVKDNLSQITWENKWLTLDEEQVTEYKEAFETAKEKVQWFLESGNPLRFNANVFTLVHQLKQVCNFSEKTGMSRKINLLLQQVDRIAKNHQKVVIFSQYDKAGIKKIEDVLKKNNIKFLSYAPGMSTKEMETVLENFSSNSSITALVSGIKPSRIKIPSGNISYVIHFDLWWNPTSLWQTEESLTSIINEGERKNLNVYSYLMKDTVEERINSLLFNKGFLNKWVMETVNPDSLTEMITNPEWLEIFDMPDQEYKQRYQKGLIETEKRIDNYSIADFMEKCKNFFTKLSYKNLDIKENKNDDSFDIRGIFKKARYDQHMCARVLSKNVVTEVEVKMHLAELKELTNNGKIFLVTKGNFEVNDNFPQNEVLINHSLLSKYFYQFIII